MEMCGKENEAFILGTGLRLHKLYLLVGNILFVLSFHTDNKKKQNIIKLGFCFSLLPGREFNMPSPAPDFDLGKDVSSYLKTV